MTIISLTEEREARETSISRPDRDGKRTWLFQAWYRGPDGRRYQVEIWARSYEDAVAHLACIKADAEIVGKLIEET